MEGSGRTARGQAEPDRRLAQARPSGPFQPRLPRGTQGNAAARVDRSGSIRYDERGSPPMVRNPPRISRSRLLFRADADER